MFDQLTASGPPEKRFGCCCGCCHVKQGTFILGILELFLTIIGLAALLNRINSHRLPTEAPTGNWSTSAVTLSPFSRSASEVGDYIGTALLSLWLLVVIALFYALFNKRPACLIPHLVLQTATLVFSLVYVILFAWDYFYVHLHIKRSEFRWSEFGARLWLVSVYAAVAAAQIYVFSAILACYRYLSDYRHRQVACEEPQFV